MSDIRRQNDPSQDGEGTPLFSMKGVRVRFDGWDVLSVDSLVVEAGAITVLMGENGSGKTTLLRVLNGLVKPEEGQVFFHGLPLSGGGLAATRAASILLHERALLFRGSVGFNVGYGLRLRGLRGAEVRDRTRDALRRVGLSTFESRRASSLSGGERQRACLARALAVAPEVLLLDEPTANVDAGSQRLIESIIQEARESGTSVILSTHDSDLASRLCDRLIRLEHGVPREDVGGIPPQS